MNSNEAEEADQLWVVTSAPGPTRDLTRGVRERAWWNEHAAYIDDLVENGTIVLGGPLPDHGGAILMVRGSSAEAVRTRLTPDPWYVNDLLRLVSIARWEVFIDRWDIRKPAT